MYATIMNSLVAVGTMICFAFFLGIVARAFSKQQRSVYEEAGQLPFDLPDEFSRENHVHPSRQASRRVL